MVRSAKDVSLETQRPSRAAQPRMHGYYVYAITNSLSLARLPEKGIDPTYPVYALPDRAIQAIVSKVSLVEFGQDVLETNLQNLQWLTAKVYAHESIIEEMLTNCTLIPMRFCTIFQSKSRVREMLDEHYDDFMNALIRLEGKKEWGLKVFGDDAILAQRIGEVSDRVKRLQMEISAKSGGAAYLWKKRLDEAIIAEIDRVNTEIAQCGHDRLLIHAEESVINPLQDKEITNRKEEMILNGAYLVADERLGAFQAELTVLENEYGALGFSFQVSGPWPPYNFVVSPSGKDSPDRA